MATARYPDAVLLDGSRTVEGDLTFLVGKKVDGVDLSENISAWGGNESGQSLYNNIKVLFVLTTLVNGERTITLSMSFVSLACWITEEKAGTSTEVFTWEKLSGTSIKIRSSNTNSSAKISVMVFGI